MSNLGRALAFGSLLVIGACGPSARNGNGGDDDGTTDAAGHTDAAQQGTCTLTGPENTAAACTDGIDNDCDGMFDCGDPDCSGIGGCPVCGQVQVPMATPLALPDGQDSGTTCSTDTQCVGKTDSAGHPTPNCIIAGDMPGMVGEDYEKGCHASYTDTLHFIGFPDGSTLTDTSKLLKVCAKMEHSWVRDLNLELIAPNGSRIQLLAWQNRSTFEEIYLGEPNDNDETGAPIPGVGYEYCWVPTGGLGHMTISPRAATTPSAASDGTLPAGDYTSDTPFTALKNTPLNGDWQFRVTDLWEVDNGFLFDWSISFDPSLVTSCTGPIIQ